ncbi:MAG: energy transducer TonB [Gemmatimonadales bacterium]|nr:MAG: energy transducer TonB [Gemmatimonadales bacterium]
MIPSFHLRLRRRRLLGSPRRLGVALFLLLPVTAACGGDPELEQPVPLYGEDPIAYPLDLWDEGVEGTALLRLLVNEEGAVDSIEVVESSGHDGLDEAARAGARDLRFEPGRVNGKRSPMWASLPVEFSTRPQAVEPD